MLVLLDTYDDVARELLQSLATADLPVTPVVIRYDGELPAGGLNPFVATTGLSFDGRPVFFDEIPVPPWAEIRQGKERFAQVLLDGTTIARIHDEPDAFRQVERVEWVLADGTLTHVDHWDRYGNLFATTYYVSGAAHQTVYRGPSGAQVEVDHVSRLVTVRETETMRVYGSLAKFVSFFLDQRGLDVRSRGGQVLINSLSHPLFVMRRRGGPARTTLFWQEPMPKDVPGNMATELGEPKALERIVFPSEHIQRKVAERHPNSALELAYLSHIGQFAEHSGAEPARAFTLTSSDTMPMLQPLLEAFPHVTFSVAALTLMSDTLHAMARHYPNLEITPRITHAGIRDELARAATYLDINRGGHVLNVVKAAYYLGLVVLADDAVAKARDQALVVGSVEDMSARFTEATGSDEDRRRLLDTLHTKNGPLSTPEDYRRVFGAHGSA